MAYQKNRKDDFIEKTMPTADQQRPLLVNELLSLRVGGLQPKIDLLKQRYLQLWFEMPTDFPGFERSYTIDQQHDLQRQASALLERFSSQAKNGSENPAQFKATMEGVAPEILRLCGSAGLCIDQGLADGFERSTRTFLRQVKQFDRQLKSDYVYQALRNVWIMNSLQVLWHHDMDCSAPMFAYSMLYPYSDNINDDPDLCADEKIAMNFNFRQWLEGERAIFRNNTEQKIYSLIRMIERSFPRDRFPKVFQSLLGIFNAQIKSLFQQRQHSSGESTDILEISIEKGGTSVLADGYLLEGELDEKQEDFCFGYGAFLQFADDLQDVEDDLANDHRTLFSQQARLGYLDGLANRLFHLMKKVVEEHLADPAQQPLRELILKNCCFMVQEAIMKTAQFYSPDYIQSLKPHFPFTPAYFQRMKKRMKQMILNEREKWDRLAI